MLNAAVPRATDVDRLHVLMINGGGTARDNFRSHVMHLERLTSLLLEAGVARERITVLASDGASPREDVAARLPDPEGFWRLWGTPVERWLAEPITYASTTLPGFTPRPATRAEVTRWFKTTSLRPGDTLLLYVTDHGEKARDPLDNRITLWGRREALSVRQLRALLGGLPAGVRVLTFMSQCFSGAFTALKDLRGPVCGYFAATADREAYGCYPEAASENEVGHSFAVFKAWAARGRLSAAHEETLLRDQTPDVPLRTSDVFLEEVVQRAAVAAGRDVNTFVDTQLAAHPQRWKSAPEAALAQNVSRAFGLPAVRSLHEVETLAAEIERQRAQLSRHQDLWDQAIDELNRDELARFRLASPPWRPRLDGMARLSLEHRRTLTTQLLDALAAFGQQDRGADDRLRALRGKSVSAGELSYRLDVKQAALLRLQSLVTTFAGRVVAGADDRKTFEALRSCEELSIAAKSRPPLGDDPPQPTLEADQATARSLHPSWLGVAYGPIARAARVRLTLPAGAVRVNQVRPGSPAYVAGVRVGDVILGEPGRPFLRAAEIRAWSMLAPRDARPLELWRAGVVRQVQVRTVPLPPP